MNPVIIAIFVVLFLLVSGYLLILLLVYKYGSKNPSVEKDENFFPSVSIVIPTRNEEGIIKKRLENIVSMSYPQDKLEVLFIDLSNDSTPMIIEEYSRKYPFIRMEKQEKPGFNNALNQGYASAKGEIVVKSDCDAFPEENALRNLVTNFADKKIGAVSGVHRVISEGEESIEKGFRGIQYGIQRLESYFHSSLVSHGAFAGYRKELIPELPPELTSDDSELVLSVIRNGYRAILDLSVVSTEYYPESFKLRREMKDRRAAGVISVIVGNIGMMFNPRYGWFGMLSLPMYSFITIVSPILFTAISILLLVYGILYEHLVIALVAVLVTIAFVLLLVPVKNKWLLMLKAVIDTNLSCLIGLFKAFKKEKTWRRSSEQRRLHETDEV